jgi:uncharacterized protein
MPLNPKQLTLTIGLFWILAVALSYLLNLTVPKDIAQIIILGYNVFSYGLGPTLAVGITFLWWTKYLKQPFEMFGIFGSDKPYKSILVFGLPIVVITFLGPKSAELNFLTALSFLIYCIGEEIGWRGWLLKNTQKYGFVIQTLVIWGLWLLWHLAFQKIDISFAILLLAGTIGINLATQKTQSLLVAVAMHAVINLVSYSAVSMIVIIPIWIVIFGSWKKESIEQ